MELIGLKGNWDYLVDEEQVRNEEKRERERATTSDPCICLTSTSAHSSHHWYIMYIMIIQGLLSDLWNEMMELIENALGGHVDGALSILKTMWMGPDMLYTFFL